jgi:cytidylate kinase
MSAKQKDPVIAIDGPSGVGKSTTAKRLAQQFDLLYLDTGAMYRAVTYAWHQAGAKDEAFADPQWLNTLTIDFAPQATLLLNGQPLTQELRTQAVTKDVSLVSANGAVREHCTRRQREIGRSRPSILDGRDIGTVVFPNAYLKIFLVASQKVRAQRRWLELGGPEASVSQEQVQQDLVERDRKDASRAIAPLKKAEDAVEVNTDHKSIEQVVDHIAELVKQHDIRAD